MNAIRLNLWRELALLCLILMEGAWAALPVSLMVRVERWIPLAQAFACLALVGLVAHLTARGLLALRARLWLRRGLVLGLIGASLWISFGLLAGYPPGSGLHGAFQHLVEGFRSGRLIPGEFLLAAAVLLVWLRGLALARDPVGSETIISSFQWGMLAWFFFGAASPPAGWEGALPIFGVYVMGGLLGMAASRVYEIGALRGARRAALRGGWAVAVIGSAGLLGALGIAAALYSQGVLGAAARFLAWLAMVGLTGLLALILLIIFSAAAGLAPWLAQHINLVAALSALEQMAQRLRDSVQPLVQSGWIQGVLELAWNSRLLALAGLLASLVIAALAWLRFQRWAERQADLEGEDAALSLAEALSRARAALRAQLSQTLARLRQRMARAGAGRLLAAARVRWVYARLMRLSARMGKPRPAAMTPLEFLPALEKLFPDHTTDLLEITQAYLRARYGELPADRAEVDQVVAAWERIKKGRVLGKTGL